MPAQGNALGHRRKTSKALKGRHHDGAPCRDFVREKPFSQGVALGWYGAGPSALKTIATQVTYRLWIVGANPACYITLKSPQMKTECRILIAGGVCLFAGCGWYDARLDLLGKTPPIEAEYAKLAKLYVAGKISAQELTKRQHVLAYWQERVTEKARIRESEESDSDPFPSADTNDQKCKDDRRQQDPRHPDPHCPATPGRR